MNARIRQYLFGSVFFAVGIYYMVNDDYLEGVLYCLAGLSFAVNTLVGEPRLAAHKKLLTIVAWVLIISTAIVFLWVMQFKYF